MLSTMQDIPLSLTRILEYGSSVHGQTQVITWHSDDPGNEREETTFADIGARAAAFAHALHDTLGVTGDERVGSFLWNCAEHLEVLFGTACKGAVFTPLNKQLMNDQIRHIVNHAEVQVIVADGRLSQQLADVLKGVECVRAVVFTDVDKLTVPMPQGIEVYSYEELLDGRSTVYDGPP